MGQVGDRPEDGRLNQSRESTLDSRASLAVLPAVALGEVCFEAAEVAARRGRCHLQAGFGCLKTISTSSLRCIYVEKTHRADRVSTDTLCVSQSFVLVRVSDAQQIVDGEVGGRHFGERRRCICLLDIYEGRMREAR